MDTREYETKVLNIDPAEIVAKLCELGAEETAEILLRRFVFDLKEGHPDMKDYDWIRLRTNGNKTTLTYKYKTIGETAIGKTIEIETDVADFDKMAQILKKIPFKRVLYQENRSHIFKLNGIEFSIDTWPRLSPHLEVEGENEAAVQEGLRLLGLEGKDVGDKDVVAIYQDELNFDLNSVPELKFAD